MSGAGAASNDGSKDTQVSAYEREINKQKAAEKAKRQAEANVEVGLGTPSKNVTDGTLSDPREKDDTAAKQSIKDSKKTTTTYERDGDGGNNNQVKVTEPVILKKNIGGTTVQTTEAKVAEDKKKSEEEYDSRKTKKKGRAKNILTSSRGVTQTSSNYSLGKPTLLGMV